MCIVDYWIKTDPDCSWGCTTIALGEPGAVAVSTDVAIMPICHNNGRFLAEAIHSVLVPTEPPAEMLVVDDASSDDTTAVAAQFGPLSDRSGCVR